MAKHAKHFKPLWRADLQSGDAMQLAYALRLAGQMRNLEVFTEVVRIFETDDSLCETAAYTSRDLDDPAASLIIARHVVEAEPYEY